MRELALGVLLMAAACGDDGGQGVLDAGPDDDAATTPDAPGVLPGTAGCGMPAPSATATWEMRPLTVGGETREVYVWLPAGYDPERRYPIVYQMHGCSSGPNRHTNNPPTQTQSGADAIHVRGKALGDCWNLSPTGPDVAYFDAMVADVEASVCADPARRFVTGYSSGAFMTHVLGCIRGDMIRGVASMAGGNAGSSCQGSVAALLIHDTTDATVNISSSTSARDAHLARNGCGTTTTPTTPSPCVAYDGCAAGKPVVWCQTTGQNHARQDALSAPAFWTFLSGLE